MGKYSRYDAANDVIVTDVTGVHATHNGIIDEIFDELVALATERPRKPWVVACWQGVKLDEPAVVAHYGERTKNLLQHVAGVMRYAASDPLTRASVRAQTLEHRAEGTRSNLYETFEEALAAVRAERRARLEHG
jgi:hypothetical protein